MPTAPPARSLSGSPRRVARIALHVGKTVLPLYSSHFSRHDYRLASLFALLVLRHFHNTDYRGIEQLARDYSDIRSWELQPLWAAALAAVTPSYVALSLRDDRVEKIPFDEPTDLVGISVETYTAHRAYQIASEYRRRGVPVVMGGSASLGRSERQATGAVGWAPTTCFFGRILP
jgi:hypothetical protein